MIEYADKEMQKKLIDACNLLCEHVCGRLPGGYEIHLQFAKGDANLELIDPDGHVCFVDSPDWGISVIDDMCVTANQLAAR